MRIVVTGGAGFIGGHVVELLLDAGHHVIVLDALRPHYDVSDRHRLMDDLAEHPSCECHVLDLAEDRLDGWLTGADVVVHLAARPGVGASWGEAFADYALDNLVASHRLLLASSAAGVGRLVVASSSSVYGRRSFSQLGQGTAPRHPYGVTKVAVEHLCHAHAALDPSTKVALMRYFTVYGPRQRPDMAVSRFIAAAEADEPVELRGAGDQTRRFTYVRDAAQATLRACTAELDGVEAFDIAGDRATSVATLVEMVEAATDRRMQVRRVATEAGEPHEVEADLELTRRRLSWSPVTSLMEGLDAQVAWSRGAHRVRTPVEDADPLARAHRAG